ncbi:retrovirus-related pol polyprotein from transposon TNT 1-94 [Tanacetum coccineum]
MANLSEDIQCAGSDTRPPMHDRTDFASWQQHIRLYCRGKENGVNILKSIDEGPFQMGTFRETLAEGNEGALHLGPERPRVYSDLSPEDEERYNADIRATNILLQGLPKDIYTLISHYTDAKDIWDNVKMLLQGSELTKEDRESQLYDDFEHFRQNKGETIHDYYGRQNRGQGNNAWGAGAAGYGGAQNRVRNSNPGQARQIKCYNCNGIGHIARNCTQPKRPQNSEYFKDKMLLMQDQENKVALDEQQLLFIASRQDNVVDEDVDEQPVQDLALNMDNVFQADDCDAFDSDVDEAPTAQTMFMANLSSAYPIYDEAIDNSLTAKLATYKEQVELYERRAKFELTEREQKINEQLRIVIVDRKRKEENLKREFHSVKLQLTSTINHNKSMVEEVTSLKKDFKQKENKYLEEFLDMKALKEKVEDKLYKQDQSLQTVHMLCKPKPYYDEQNKVAIGYKNPLCLTRAKQVQPALYNGHEIIKTNHVPAIVHNSEDTLEIAEITRKKMNDKMKDPECVKKKVKIAPHDYSKENYLATFTPQKQLTPEQIFWSKDLIKMKAEALKEQTTASRPIKALTIFDEIHVRTLLFKARSVLELEAELSKLLDKVQKDDHTELVKHFSNLELRSNTKKNRILTAKSVNKKKVEEHIRTNKSSLKTMNRIDSSISFKHTVINSNSHSVCKTCNKCLISANHDMCVVNYLHSVNASPSVKNDVRKVQQVWKPKQVKQVWKPTGKILTNIGYQWMPTGRTFTLGEQCPLTRLTKSKVVHAKQTENVSSHGYNLYTISVEDMMKSSPICLFSKASKNKSLLWNRHLNLLNFGTINDLARKDLVRGLPRLKFVKDHLCSACQLVQTINGKKYILVLVDDYSRFTWVKLLRSKDETPENGVIERRNRTLVETAKTMLIFSKDLMFLWAEAVATSSRILENYNQQLILEFSLVMHQAGRVTESTTKEPDEL